MLIPIPVFQIRQWCVLYTYFYYFLLFLHNGNENELPWKSCQNRKKQAFFDFIQNMFLILHWNMRLKAFCFTSALERWLRSAPLGPGGRPGRSQTPRASSSEPWSPLERPFHSPSETAGAPFLQTEASNQKCKNGCVFWNDYTVA